MVQLFVKRDDEEKEDKQQVKQPEAQPESGREVAERIASREEMEKKKAQEVMQSATAAAGSTWVSDAERKLREAQVSYETEKLRQDLLGEISGMNTEQMTRLNDLISKF